MLVDNGDHLNFDQLFGFSQFQHRDICRRRLVVERSEIGVDHRATGAAPGVGDTGDAVMSRWSTAEGLPLGLQLLGGLRTDRALAETAQWFFERRESASRCSPRTQRSIADRR